MIQLAIDFRTQDLKEVYERCWTNRSRAWADVFFDNVIRPQDAYVDVENGMIAAEVFRIRHSLLFNGRILQASVISGACTVPDCRGQGRMHRLMDTVVDACSHQELVTLIVPNGIDTVDNYAQWGFEPVYTRQRYLLQRPDCRELSRDGIVYDVPAGDLLNVYSTYIRRFNGFKARTLRYFENLQREVNAVGGRLVGYFGEDNQLHGYAVISMRGRDGWIDELVYTDSLAIWKLVNTALTMRQRVILDVSSAENMSRLFPSAQRMSYDSAVVRLNQPELFSRLFRAQVSSAKEAFELSSRPLNFNERY